MAADAGKLYVDAAGLDSGTESSRYASDHAQDSVNHLSGASVGGTMFGDFEAADSFAQKVGAAHADHIRILQNRQESLNNLASNADTIAADFTEQDHHNAAALRAIRCNSTT
jgi:uncharacterized protein DUF2563